MTGLTPKRLEAMIEFTKEQREEVLACGTRADLEHQWPGDLDTIKAEFRDASEANLLLAQRVYFR